MSMKISKVTVQNYRGIKDCTIEASPFVCLIGENNSGKSSFLLALSLFFSGTSLSKNDFYNEDEKVTIDVTFDEITEGDLLRLTSDQAERIKQIIVQNSLTLVRVYELNGKSNLLCRQLAPIEERYKQPFIDALLKGKNKLDLLQVLKETYHENKEEFEGINTQTAAKSKLQEIIQLLPDIKKEKALFPLPTGMEASIKNLLPEPIYITAVKDFKDDVKVRETTSFGKLLGILLNLIEQEENVLNAWQALDQLFDKMNKTVGEDGTAKDNRFKQIKEVEETVAGILNTNFPNVNIEIKIPKPELKQILSNALLIIDDGVPGQIESKGDGLKRSVTFALLRAYVELNKKNKSQKVQENSNTSVVSPTPHPYVFLFEEPELYLHPSAQRILFDALQKLTVNQNQVFVSTHSPLFFSPEATGTFVKLRKVSIAHHKPFTDVSCVNLIRDFAAKDVFQIVCFENNSAAFFANQVLLVEGDCDQIYIKGIAKCLNAEWDFDSKNIPVIRIDGKGNVKRFKSFFEKFNIKVSVLLDADAMIDGFEKLDVATDISHMRNMLMGTVESLVSEQNIQVTMNGDKVSKLVSSYTFANKYNRLKDIVKDIQGGRQLTEEEIRELNLLFFEEEKIAKRKVYTESDATDFIKQKNDLLSLLRKHNIFILSRGAIEKYYPEGVTGSDKPSKALNALAKLKEIEDLKDFLPKILDGETEKCEISSILEVVFSSD